MGSDLDSMAMAEQGPHRQAWIDPGEEILLTNDSMSFMEESSSEDDDVTDSDGDLAEVLET